MKLIEKKLSLILGGIFLLSFVILSIAEYRGMHAEYPEAWRVSFVDPMSQDMTFAVQNGTKNTEFSYVIFSDKKTVAQGVFEIALGEEKQVALSEVVADSNVLQGKVRIRVKDVMGGEREIFKIISE